MIGAAADDTANPRPKKVWATVLTSNTYLPALFVLEHSLRRARSAYPLIALYTDDLSAEVHHALDVRSFPQRRIPELLSTLNRISTRDTRFTDTWSKLAVFGLVEFERIILLDSDMQVFQNMDELMDQRYLSLDVPGQGGNGYRVFAASHACVCNPLKDPHYPEDWIPENCAYSLQHQDTNMAQGQAQGNDKGLGTPDSGFLVLNPCAEILDAARTKLIEEDLTRYIFPIEQFLAELFSRRWVTLPYVYNALKPMRKEHVHGAIWRDHEVRTLNYVSTPEPWEETEELADEENALWYTSNKDRIASEQDRGFVDAPLDKALVSGDIVGAEY